MMNNDWGGKGWGKLYYSNMVMIFIDDNDNDYNQDNVVLHLIIKLRSILAPKISSS